MVPKDGNHNSVKLKMMSSNCSFCQHYTTISLIFLQQVILLAITSNTKICVTTTTTVMQHLNQIHEYQLLVPALHLLLIIIKALSEWMSDEHADKLVFRNLFFYIYLACSSYTQFQTEVVFWVFPFWTLFVHNTTAPEDGRTLTWPAADFFVKLLSLYESYSFTTFSHTHTHTHESHRISSASTMIINS